MCNFLGGVFFIRKPLNDLAVQGKVITFARQAYGFLYRDIKSKIRYNPVNKPHSPKVNPSVFATGLCHRELYREKVVRRLLTQHNRHLRREQQQKNKLIIE